MKAVLSPKTEIIVFIYNRLKDFFRCNFSYIYIIFKTYEFLILYICCGTEKGKWRFRGECEITQTLKTIVWIIWFKKCWNLTRKIRNIRRTFKIIINRDLLDEMLRLFYCLLFPVRAFKKIMEIRAGGGVLELGNPGRRGALAVWEIQSEGGVKNACHPSGVCVFFLE